MFCCRELHAQGNTNPSPELAGITRYPLVCVEHFLSRCQLQPSDLFKLTSYRLGGSPFCLHSLRQLVWWQEWQLLGVVMEGEGEAVVELSLHLDRDTHCVEVNTWSVHILASTLFVCPSLLPSSSSPPSPFPLLPSPSHTTLSPGPLLCLTANPDTQTAIAQLTDGTILRYNSGCLLPWQLPSGQELKFPEQACDHITLATFNRQVRMCLGSEVWRDSENKGREPPRNELHNFWL